MNPVDHSATLRDVAKKAGVSLATVSRALRNDPVTAVKTREHIKKVAELLGYRPDPGMAGFVERRWRGRRKAGGQNLAFIYNSLSPTAAVAKQEYAKFRKDAEALGYTLLAKDLSAFKDATKMAHQLRAQGVAGLVLAQLPVMPYPIEALLEKFPAVSVGVSTYQPPCPIILHDEFHGICHAWDRLEQLGYERIGVLLPEYPNSVSFDLRLGAILCRQNRLKIKKNRIPIMFLEEGRIDPDALADWINSHRPDVVLGHEHQVAKLLMKLGSRLTARVPFATFNLWDKDYRGEVAGYFRDNVALFQRGMLLLSLMIRSGSTGSAHAKLIELVDGEWIEGVSLPERG